MSPRALSAELDEPNSGEVIVSSDHRKCLVDSDCVVVSGHCCGCSCGKSINKHFQKLYDERFKVVCQDYNGVCCDMDCPPLELRCKNELCFLVEKSSPK